jgi:predicted enzyme related to lactoylglutathione lyase
MPSNFVWYELMTTELDAAAAFYKTVVGWNSERWDNPQMRYTIVKAGDTGVGGLMTIPAEAAQMGARPAWLGYISADDVDAATDGVRQTGGTVHREPADIPEIGRFSVVADPQGAMFILFRPQGDDRPPVPPMTPGHIGWHELYAAEWKSAFDFYAGQFGWTKADAMDMGEMGTYQLFSAGGEPIGGMMTKPADVPSPFWLFYFNVGDIDAAAERVTGNGGKVLMGPMEVPGGSWIVQATDPQGAMFALAGGKG